MGFSFLALPIWDWTTSSCSTYSLESYSFSLMEFDKGPPFLTSSQIMGPVRKRGVIRLFVLRVPIHLRRIATLIELFFDRESTRTMFASDCGHVSSRNWSSMNLFWQQVVGRLVRNLKRGAIPLFVIREQNPLHPLRPHEIHVKPGEHFPPAYRDCQHIYHAR